jgi:hypothetical protein
MSLLLGVTLPDTALFAFSELAKLVISAVEDDEDELNEDGLGSEDSLASILKSSIT